MRTRATTAEQLALAMGAANHLPDAVDKDALIETMFRMLGDLHACLGWDQLESTFEEVEDEMLRLGLIEQRDRRI